MNGYTTCSMYIVVAEIPFDYIVVGGGTGPGTSPGPGGTAGTGQLPVPAVANFAAAGTAAGHLVLTGLGGERTVAAARPWPAGKHHRASFAL
jgi:hypothetical protein